MSLETAFKAANLFAMIGWIALALAPLARVRLILTTGTERLAVPGIPNAISLNLPELNIEEWVGFFISPETEPALQEEWNDRLASALTDELLIDDLRGLGAHVTATTIDETKSRLRLYMTSWRQRLDDLGLAPQDKPR